jgi:hypothetical protein
MARWSYKPGRSLSLPKPTLTAAPAPDLDVIAMWTVGAVRRIQMRDGQVLITCTTAPGALNGTLDR